MARFPHAFRGFSLCAGLALVATLGAAAPEPAPVRQTTPARQPSDAITVQFDDQADPLVELLDAINASRQSFGLPPLSEEPALVRVARDRAEEAATSGQLDGDAALVMELSRRMRAAGYPPHAWRQRLVQGPRTAEALVRQWRESDPDGYEAVALGDFEGFGAAIAREADPPLWSLFVALPRITWERRETAALDDVAAIREAVLQAVNAERAAHRLRPLVIEARLAGAAQAHATDMLSRRYYDHVSPEGRDLRWRVDQAGYSFRWAAENIAKGAFTPEEVVRRWMLSSGHRRNILDPHPTHVGIGLAKGEENGSVTALWVLDFGAPG